MATGSLHWDSQGAEQGTSLQLGQQDIASMEVPSPGCACSPSITPVEWGKSIWALPLAVNIVLAKLRLCRPLGLFSTCRLKAETPDGSREL